MLLRLKMVYGNAMSHKRSQSTTENQENNQQVVERAIALVGLMGVGKTTIGRRLATRLKLPFQDSDTEIERASGCTIADLFDRIGEDAFRMGERRVIDRLLDGTPKILATGGGAFAQPDTRKIIQARAITIWLDADVETLVDRTSRRNTRPLLNQGDPKAVLSQLAQSRRSDYSQADIHISSTQGPHTRIVGHVLEALEDFLGEKL